MNENFSRGKKKKKKKPRNSAHGYEKKEKERKKTDEFKKKKNIEREYHFFATALERMKLEYGLKHPGKSGEKFVARKTNYWIIIEGREEEERRGWNWGKMYPVTGVNTGNSSLNLIRKGGRLIVYGKSFRGKLIQVSWQRVLKI